MWWWASRDKCIAPAAVLHPDHCSSFLKEKHVAERCSDLQCGDLPELSASVVSSGVGKWKSGGTNLTFASSRCGNQKAVSSHLAAESIMFCRNRWWHSVVRWKNPTDKQLWTIMRKMCTCRLSDIYCFILVVIKYLMFENRRRKNPTCAAWHCVTVIFNFGFYFFTSWMDLIFPVSLFPVIPISCCIPGVHRFIPSASSAITITFCTLVD